MIDLAFSLEDATRVRFGISPLGEVVHSIQVMTSPAQHPGHARWAQVVRTRLRSVDFAPLFALIAPTGYFPDFLTPPPGVDSPDTLHELEAVRETPAEVLVSDVSYIDNDELTPPVWRTTYAPLRRKLAKDPERAVRDVTQLLAIYWKLALEPYWARLEAMLRNDVLGRSQVLAARGAEGLFSTLGNQVNWCNDRLTVNMRYSYHSRLAGRGLILMPSAFRGRQIGAVIPPYQPALVFRAPGTGTLWETGPGHGTGELEALIGRMRARVLERLATPTSTTELARCLSVTPGAVSQHLAVLRGVGLVTSRRVGRSVLYARAPLGDLLIASRLR